jgi:fibronectin-binding autotransporter adhesin
MATYYYDTNGSTAGFGTLTGTWAGAFWSTSSAGTSATASVTTTTADNVWFGFTGTTATAGSVSLSAVSVGSINVENLGGSTQTLTGTLTSIPNGFVVAASEFLAVSATIGTTNGITKSGSGTLILSSSGNNYTGAINLTGGQLQVASSGFALGATTASNSTLGSGTSLYINGSLSVNKSGTAFTNNGCTIQAAGVTSFTYSAMTMGASFTLSQLSAGSTFTVAGPITGGGVGQTLTVTGGSSTGVVSLTNTGSTFVSAVDITQGILSVAKLADAGVASSIGSPAAGQATITAGSAGNAGITHNSTTVDSTTRPITFSGGASSTFTFSVGGTGAITWASGGAFTLSNSGSKTIIFRGANANNNVFARDLADPPTSGTTAITKMDAGYWSLTGAINSTGVITSSGSGGTLHLGATDRNLTGGLSITSGTLSITNGNTVTATTTMNGGNGNLTAILAGSSTITVTSFATSGSPAKITPDSATGSNQHTGAVAINGYVDLIAPVDVATVGNGSVLGVSNTVTVSSTGVIRTKWVSGGLQQGSARYHNLTFQSDGYMIIGGAA